MAGTLLARGDRQPVPGADPCALHLSARLGLEQVEGGRAWGFMIAVDPADHGIDVDLAMRIARWVSQYRAFDALWPGLWTPAHCRDFDVDAHNDEGLAIAQGIVEQLPQGRVLHFDPLLRKGAWFHSYLMERGTSLANHRVSPDLGGPPLPSYRDAGRDPARWLRVMPDECSSGIWQWDGCAMDPDDLPVADRLKDRLESWASRYDSLANVWRPGCDDSFARLQEQDRLSRLYSDEGLAISRSIKAALPGWTVVYFDDDLADRHAIRAMFEFEIV